MLSVSLFVGALALNMMFDMYTPRRYPKTAFSWLLSKATIWGPFVLGESLIVYALLCGIDGLNPVHGWATLGLIVLTALCAMLLVNWLNLAFGKLGAFLSMVLLVLQLSGSAGTYPIQLSNHFFQWLHPYLPMTYSVAGLRETLMIGGAATSAAITLCGICVVLLGLIWLFYLRRLPRLKAIDFRDPRAVRATQSRLAARIEAQKD
jgi:putative membrane protein